MTERTQRILIGSLGWQHDEWQGDYYPEDLPPEWRLGYYSNEFPLVVITGREAALPAAELSDELADCREDLLVLIVVTAADTDPDLAPALDLLERLPREGALLLSIDPASIADPEAWLAQVRTQAGQVPVCVAPQAPLTSVWLAALRRHVIGWSWNVHSDRDGLNVGSLAVIQLEGTLPAKQLREYIEAGLAANDPARQVALVFSGTPPPIEMMRQARLIEELM